MNVTACCVVCIPDSSERMTSMTVVSGGCGDISIGDVDVDDVLWRSTCEDLPSECLRSPKQAVPRAMDAMGGE